MSGILKVFIEKHLTPTLLSIVFACIAFVLTPDAFALKMKLGFTIYGIFLFCSSFVLIQFSILLKKKVVRFFYELEQKQYLMESQEADNKKAIEGIWSFVDQLDDNDYQALQTFINTNNQPIYYKGRVNYNHQKLISSDVVAKTRSNNLMLGHEMYRLKDDFFGALKYSQEKYGRISHFHR